MADGPEQFGFHDIGKPDDGIERRAQFVADAGDQVAPRMTAR
jgi:hypothetical protein